MWVGKAWCVSAFLNGDGTNCCCDAVGGMRCEAGRVLLPSVYVTQAVALQPVLSGRSGPAMVAIIALDPTRHLPWRRSAAVRIAASRQNAAKRDRVANHATSLSRPMMFIARVKL